MSGGSYYVPPTSKWPILASLALGAMMIGAGTVLVYGMAGMPVMATNANQFMKRDLSRLFPFVIAKVCLWSCSIMFQMPLIVAMSIPTMIMILGNWMPSFDI